MNKYFHNYLRYSHELIAKFIELTSHLYELEFHDKISDKEKVIRLERILNSFEQKTKHLFEDMVTYHLMDSKLPKLSHQVVFYHLQLEFKYILN